MTRRLIALVAATIGCVLLAWPAAAAKYRGTDVLGNIAPDSMLDGGSLADRHPLSAYSLDYHTDVGVTDLDGVPATIAHWASAQLWSLTSFLSKTVIDLLTWAFSLDLLGGSGAGNGALAPVADAITSLYENVIGEAWMVAAVLLAGIWGIWKALVQRRYTETAGALAVSVLFVVLALFFVYQPERTIGQASEWTNTLSLAFLSGANRGTIDDPDKAKRQVADQLFEAQIYRPWVVLNFGGLRHCVDTDRTDADEFPRPVGPNDPARDVCRDHMRRGRDGFGGYAPRFLRHAPGSDERNAEYEALKTGEIPNGDGPSASDCPRGDCSITDSGADARDRARQFAHYKVDKADAPAVDVQQAGGAFQRLTLTVVVFIGALGAIALLGMLSLAVILAQIVALVLLGFAPVALIIGIFPRGGHEFFRNWLAKLATAIFIKALYSLVIAVVIAVSAALSAATEPLGFLFAFVLQAIFFWAIFLYRKEIAARLVSATTGAAHDARGPGRTVVQRGADIAMRPFGALLAVPGRGVEVVTRKQESALAGDSQRPDGPTNGSGAAGTLGDDHDSPLVARASGKRPHPAPAAVPAPASPAPNGKHAASGRPLGASNGAGAAAPDDRPGHESAGPVRDAGHGNAPRRDPGPEEPGGGPVVVPVGSGTAQQHARDDHPATVPGPGSPATGTAQDASPRASHEDVMRRARELRRRAELEREHPDRAA